jgi:hypothetical protein
MTSRHVVIPTLAAAAVLSATALAATPKAGLWTTNGGEGGGAFTVASGKIKKQSTAPSTFKCNKFNAVIPSSIRIAGGRFSYSGKLMNQPGTIVFKGSFTSATKAKGTATITKGSCSSTMKWTATHQ